MRRQSRPNEHIWQVGQRRIDLKRTAAVILRRRQLSHFRIAKSSDGAFDLSGKFLCRMRQSADPSPLVAARIFLSALRRSKRKAALFPARRAAGLRNIAGPHHQCDSPRINAGSPGSARGADGGVGSGCDRATQACAAGFSGCCRDGILSLRRAHKKRHALQTSRPTAGPALRTASGPGFAAQRQSVFSQPLSLNHGRSD